VYPDEARSAEIEGTVGVEAVVDCSGKVTQARVVTSLGHGLDAAALTAIQKTEFDPAPRCAPGFQKSVKINYAFRLGD
jgi:protein TonB